MKNKRTISSVTKLSLRKESIRILAQRELTLIAGGDETGITKHPGQQVNDDQPTTCL
jgi:hypothetical protein